MAAAVKTSTTELGDSRVRVDVEVPTEALERELQSAAGTIGREMRVPGFRKGKVPAQVVIQQVGARQCSTRPCAVPSRTGTTRRARTPAGTQPGIPRAILKDLPGAGNPLQSPMQR